MHSFFDPLKGTYGVNIQSALKIKAIGGIILETDVQG